MQRIWTGNIAPIMSEEEERRRRLAQMIRAQASGMTAGTSPAPQRPQMTREQMAQMMPETAAREAAIKRQRDTAQALRGKDRLQGRTVGPSGIYVAPTAGDIAATLGEGLLSYRLGKQATTAEKEVTAEKRAAALERAMQAQEEQAYEDQMAADERRYARNQDALARYDRYGLADFKANRQLALQERGFEREQALAQAEREAERFEVDGVLVDYEGSPLYEGPSARGGRSGWSKPTETQIKAAYHAENMRKGIDDMQSLLDDDEYNISGVVGLWDTLMTKNDFLNNLATAGGQEFQSAAGTIRESALRVSTGAAAPESEQKDYVLTLIPRAGDDKSTIEYKMNKLREVQANIQRLAGPAAADLSEEEAVEQWKAAVDSVRDIPPDLPLEVRKEWPFMTEEKRALFR